MKEWDDREMKFFAALLASWFGYPLLRALLPVGYEALMYFVAVGLITGILISVETLASLIFLVGIMPSRADIKVVRLSSIGSIEKAKIGVPNNFEAAVQKTALNDQSLFAVHNSLIHGWGNFSSQIVTAKSGGGEHDLTRFESRCCPAIIQCIANPSERSAATFLIVRGNESIDVKSKIERRFSSSIGIFEKELYRFSSFNRACNFSQTWSYPCPSRDDQTFARYFDRSNHCIGLFVGSLSLFSRSFSQLSIGVDKLARLLPAALHLPELPSEKIRLVEDASSRGDDEKQSPYLSPLFAAILSVLLCAISFLLVAVGVYKSREPGYGGLLVFAAIPFWYVGMWIFFAGVLGWHSLNPLDRRSENVLVEAIIIPELELRNSG